MNFLCISNYNNNVDWITDYTNDYIIYDRSDTDEFCKKYNYIKSPNIGYNIYDIFTFIIENYENLPEVTTFCKGNIFPRHVTRDRFEQLMNSKILTAIFEPGLHKPEMPVCMFSCDGQWSEINTSWYMTKTKYFSNYNQFLNFCYKDPILPKYITFCPGANYTVPKSNILKYEKTFYENLRYFVSWDQLATESHMIERFLYTMWTCSFKVSENMKRKIYEK